MALAMTREMMRRVLNAARDHTASGNFDGPLYGSKVLLFTDPALTPGPDTVLADLTEPAYTGYARVALTWGAPHVEDGPTYEVSTGLSEFAPTDNLGTPAVVYGYGVVDSTASPNTLLLFAELFPAPISLATTDDYLGIVNQFRIGGAEYGTAVLVQ